MNFRTFFIHGRCWGKILGACFGFLMGGPVGAFFGILVGNVFDRGLNQHFNRPYWDLYTTRRDASYDTFISTTFLIMGYLAKSGGRVSERAILYAKNVMKELQLNKTQIALAKTQFNLGKTRAFDLTLILTQFKSVMGSQQNLIQMFLTIQYQACLNDGFNPAKQQAMNHVLRLLGYAPMDNQTNQDHAEAFSSRYHTQGEPNASYRHNLNLTQAYHTLDLPPTASKQAVKQAYRRLISRHHPDKLMASGKSKLEIQQANEKTHRIRKAYEAICEAKGW